MILKNIEKKESYIHMERYVNIFKKVANEISQKYDAVKGVKSFILPEFLLNKNQVRILYADPNKSIKNKIVSNKKVRFFVHPEMIDEFKGKFLINLKTKASPTSSSRSLLLDREKFVVKTHLNKRLSKFIRRLTESSVEHSILVSQELSRIENFAPKTFGYLPETIGIVLQDKGMIIREMTPRPIINKKRYLIPLFSIYSKDSKNKNEPLLIKQIVKASKKKALAWLKEDLLIPLFKNIDFVMRKTGLLLEPHGQNTLLEIDKEFKIKRIIHRDFQSMYVDPEFRKRNKLSMIFKKHLMGKECKPEISYSLVYNQYMGQYVFDNIVDVYKKLWRIPKEKTIGVIRRTFKEEFNENFKKKIPKNHYYFMKKGTFNGNNVIFVRVNKNPRYVG